MSYSNLIRVQHYISEPNESSFSLITILLKLFDETDLVTFEIEITETRVIITQEKCVSAVIISGKGKLVKLQINPSHFQGQMSRQ